MSRITSFCRRLASEETACRTAYSKKPTARIANRAEAISQPYVRLLLDKAVPSRGNSDKKRILIHSLYYHSTFLNSCQFLRPIFFIFCEKQCKKKKKAGRYPQYRSALFPANGRLFTHLFGVLDLVLVLLDHLLDHLAADGTGLLGGQVAVVALLQIDANLTGGLHLELVESFLCFGYELLVGVRHLVFSFVYGSVTMTDIYINRICRSDSGYSIAAHSAFMSANFRRSSRFFGDESTLCLLIVFPYI